MSSTNSIEQSDELETELADRVASAVVLVRAVEYSWRDAMQARERLGYARVRVDDLDLDAPGLGEVRSLAATAHRAAYDLEQALAPLAHAASDDDDIPF
jgi:hypothetical protein